MDEENLSKALQKIFWRLMKKELEEVEKSSPGETRTKNLVEEMKEQLVEAGKKLLLLLHVSSDFSTAEDLVMTMMMIMTMTAN